MTRRSLPLALVPLFLAACQGDGGGGQQATATTATIPVETTAATTTTTANPTTTEVSERLARWQDVVKSMQCPELAILSRSAWRLPSTTRPNRSSPSTIGKPS